jgi:nucleoside-diphosphate-sugar epimerase
MRYFLTGATGFIGGHVARQLRAEGHEVVALVRDPDKARDLADLGVNLYTGDVTDKESMRAPMTGVDGIFHIAGWYRIGVRDKSEASRVNVDGTRNTLELMRDLAIPRGVYTSTLAVNSDTQGYLADETYHFAGRHISEYDRTKWQAHFEVAEPMIKAGLPLIVVEPGLVYGPGDASAGHDALVQFLQGKLPMIPKRTAFCWGHVEDTARGHLQAMEKGVPGETYMICGPVHAFIEAMFMAQQVTSIPRPKLTVGPGVLKAMAALMSAIEKVMPVPADYSAEYFRVNAGVTYIGTNAKARRELGFEPRPLRKGLAETLRYEMHKLGMTVDNSA